VHKLFVYTRKDHMKRGFDEFWRDHGQAVFRQSAYKVTMVNGERIMFTVIADPQDFYKIEGQRFDEIELMEPVSQNVADFLLSKQLPREDSDE
jgi:hypothetical protein